MNATEFKTWFKGHTAAFPGIIDQLARLRDDTVKAQDAEISPVSQRDVLAAWKDAFKEITLHAAQEATRRLIKGDPESPRWLDDHPRMVLAAARKVSRLGKEWDDHRPPGPQFKMGIWSFECVDCEDNGHVLIFSVEAMQAMRDGTWDDRFRHRHSVCAIRCHCKWGECFRGFGNEVFMPDKMVRCAEKPPTDSDVERLRQFFVARATQDSYA